MEVGDLVRWQHPSETDVGIIMEVSENPCGLITDYYVYWGDGCRHWHENEDLEVIDGSR